LLILTFLTFTALGSGILFSYPQLATITGVQGVVVYAISSAAPLMIFAYLGPIIRKKCPEGFVLTEWTRQRYGFITALYLSFLTLVTMFLYMVAELSALQQIMSALTGMDGLPMVIVECAVTTIYTCKKYERDSGDLWLNLCSPRRLQDLLHYRQYSRRHGGTSE
jgi:Na+/proline symporter